MHAGLPFIDGTRPDDGVAAMARDRFVALAAAFVNCGVMVHVPDGVVLDKPIQLVFATPEGSDDAVFPLISVILGANARATVIERHVGSAETFVCGTAHAIAGPGAQLDYVAVQQTGESARVFMHRGATCAANASVRLHVAELGGTLVRSVLDLQLAGEGARAGASALFFNTGFQHVDLTTTTAHAVGNTTSDTVVRSAASDRGQGRFFGNIAIRPAAHGADASLRDDALLLSKRAHIDSVPALEIAANDVKAFHGATVGSLDEEALFYAGSRGIARADAARMVALAFFEPVISRLPSEALRDEVRTALDHKIDSATELGA
jgi:Fe-S cluster assembly protein SufD